jgi:cell division protein FtsB
MARMRYLNIILTIIAIILLIISFHLINLKALLAIFNQNSQAIKNSNQELVDSNNRLQKSFSDSTKELEKLNNKILLE